MKKILLIAAAAIVSFNAFSQPKFAHVNMNELVQLMPEMDQARKIMDTSSQEAQETYQSMVEEFNSKYQKYEQTASTASAAIREAKEKELTEIQQRIQEFQQTIQMELQQKQQELMAPIYEKVQKTVNDIAKANGFIYVFDVVAVLYIDDKQSVDITPQARKTLNIPDDRTLETLAQELQAAQQAAAAQ